MKKPISSAVRALTLTTAVIALVLAATALPAGASHAPVQGFGAQTPGGAGRPVVRVTNLNDSGSGSLRAALSGGNRTIVFDVAGEIYLRDYLRVRGSHVTIDGTTAPAPGITLRGHGLGIQGLHGAHDVIVRGLRIRDAVEDGIGVGYGAYNVLIEHVSIHGSGDGNLDITNGAHDVTVAWCILAEPGGSGKNMLIKYLPERITLHHNLFVGARQRNPQVRMSDLPVPALDTTVDMRGNVVWDWRGGYGTWIADGARANVVDNLYAAPRASAREQAQALAVDRALVYASGNVSLDPAAGDLDAEGTVNQPFPAPPVDRETACVAAHRVVAAAGARPLDTEDLRMLEPVALPTCSGSEPPSPAPAPPPPPAVNADLAIAGLAVTGTAHAGGTIQVTLTAQNLGTATAGGSVVHLYLSTSPTIGAGAQLLGQQVLASLAAGGNDPVTIVLTLPDDLAEGSYYLVAGADAEGAVAESNEDNNTQAVELAVAAAPQPQDDLVVTGVMAGGPGAPGVKVPVECMVENRGGTAARSLRVRFFLSAGHPDGDALLGVRNLKTLSPGEQIRVALNIRIPEGTPAGTGQIITVLDSQRQEPLALAAAPLSIR